MKHLFPQPKDSHAAFGAQSGMTLLEIMISISLMMIMTIATAAVLRSGLDMRVELSARSRVTHRMNIVLSRLSDDIQHAYLINSQQVFIRKAEIKTLFRVKPWDNSSELRLTTMNHVPRVAGSHESDQTFVMYRIEKDTQTNRPILYRGETSVVPENLEQDIPMTVLSRGIKSLKIKPWTGDAWRDDWDSSRSDWRDTLPRMVSLEIEAYSYDPVDPNEPIAETDPTVSMRTVVFIPRAVQMKEVKDPAKTPVYW